MNGKKDWMIGPSMFFGMIAVLLIVWYLTEPASLIRMFDNSGRSPVELATVPVFLALVPAVWILRPFEGSRARVVTLSIMVSVVSVMAVVKELDLHNELLHWCFPQFVGEDGSLVPGLVKPDGRALTGTPFKMRVLTNAAVPLAMKGAIILYFVAFFGVFAAGFAYLFRKWLKGVLSLDGVSWMWGCFGASGIIVQIADRLPSWLGGSSVLSRTAEHGVTPLASLVTCLEEGSEMMLAVLAMATMVLASRRKK